MEKSKNQKVILIGIAIVIIIAGAMVIKNMLDNEKILNDSDDVVEKVVERKNVVLSTEEMKYIKTLVSSVPRDFTDSEALSDISVLGIIHDMMMNDYYFEDGYSVYPTGEHRYRTQDNYFKYSIEDIVNAIELITNVTIDTRFDPGYAGYDKDSEYYYFSPPNGRGLKCRVTIKNMQYTMNNDIRVDYDFEYRDSFGEWDTEETMSFTAIVAPTKDAIYPFRIISNVTK